MHVGSGGRGGSGIGLLKSFVQNATNGGGAGLKYLTRGVQAGCDDEVAPCSPSHCCDMDFLWIGGG